MKKYLLFTGSGDRFEICPDYYVFQGDYETLGEAFRAATRMAHDEATLCVYRIVTWNPHAQAMSMPQVYGAKVQRCVAEGFVNGEPSFAIPGGQHSYGMVIKT